MNCPYPRLTPVPANPQTDTGDDLGMPICKDCTALAGTITIFTLANSFVKAGPVKVCKWDMLMNRAG